MGPQTIKKITSSFPFILIFWIIPMSNSYYLPQPHTRISSTMALKIKSSCAVSQDAIWEVKPEDDVPIGNMPIYTASKSEIQLKNNTPGVMRQDITGLSDVFMIHNVLSREECEHIISISEAMGYNEFDAGKNTHGALTWVGNEEALMTPLYERCEPFFPKKLDKQGVPQVVTGLNARLRFYRYQPNGKDEFRPHVDDSFPGTGLSEDGKQMIWDKFGDRYSMLSFLLYLNDDFYGGHTTFYPEGLDGQRIKVKPQQGSALCFFQSFHLGNEEEENQMAPLHEGSSVVSDSSVSGNNGQETSNVMLSKIRPKYIIRSDVLYKRIM
mmetsp:Transcript_4634/g.5987  ORF Transcript_4634/g.5987 Transcript_4634/m.5987 type:complete len:325 (+) Transcript_4634:50-1024(+)